MYIIENEEPDLFGNYCSVADTKMNADLFGNEDQIGWLCHENTGIGIINPRALKRLVGTEDFMRGQKFKVKKDKLVAAIEKNRDKHSNEYVDAVIGYQEAVVKALRKQAKKVNAVNLFGETGQLNDPGMALQGWACADMPERPPECHLDDYDQALRMLKVIEDEVLEMDASEIDRYVYDNWVWKNQHVNAVALYASKARKG